VTMSPDSEPRPRMHAGKAIAALAIVALLVGVAVAFGPWTRRHSTAPDPGAPADTSEGAIGRALGHTRDDSLSRWVSDIPGADLSGLDAREQRIFVRFANAERCTCGCGYTLAACRVYDDQCEVSGPRVTSLLDSVRAGWILSADGLRDEP